MTKKILTLTFLLAITGMIAMAQVPTTYRGAFEPAPTPMWTDNWTNWDPQNASYGAPTVTVTGVITSNTTWTKDNVYLLQGTVFVDSLVTLTIEAGTVVRGDANTVISALSIQRGGKIIANGTPCNPIVFTSSKAIGARLKGDWGGLIICGRALNNLGTNVPIEGIGATNPRARHGGSIPNDNSGSLSYVRIEYAGFVIAANNEMNGLTMGSVGSGTTINHVEVSYGLDDAFEWFGGSVNCSHLVAYRCLDDDFDTDNGYSGLVQFALGVKDPAVADAPAVSTSEGWESDNNATSPFTILPKTSASFYNVTQIGAFRCGSNAGGISQPTADGFRRGARLRRNTELKIHNSIFMNNWRGLIMDADVIANGLAAFKNNVIAMDYSTVWSAPYAGTTVAAENTATATYLNNPANGNSIVSAPCDVLVNAWSFTNPDFRPNSAGSGAALSGADLTPGIQIETALFNANQTAELLVDIFENAVGNSNGTITVTIPVPSGFTLAVPSIATLSSTPTSGTNGTSAFFATPYNNGDWNFSLSGGFVTATSKAGVSIPQAGLSTLGFTIKRNTGTPAGTNSNLVITVSGGSDSTPANNSANNSLSTL
ncbi:MAG: hypothetical protein IPI46_08140 [Bacteroidetes bacterium]|nr:hypothetical protein [Bacteroidota bacterium]